MPELDLKSLTIIGLELIKKNSLPPTDDDLHDGLSSTTFRTWWSNYGHRPRVIYNAWCLIEDEMYEDFETCSQDTRLISQNTILFKRERSNVVDATQKNPI